MKRTYKFRLYPDKSQLQMLEQTLNTCRHLYNDSLAERRDAYSNSGRIISYHSQTVALPSKKEENPYLPYVHSQVLQDVLRRVDKAFKNFFRRVKSKNENGNGERPGYPRFKGRNRYDSFTYPQSGFKIEGNSKRLVLSKIGSIKIKLHRQIPNNATIKICTIRRDVDQWYACFSVELPDSTISVPKRGIKEIKNAVGIDLGLDSIATLSNGIKIGNPRWLSESEKKLAKEQRRLSRTKKGSNNRNKQRIKVAKTHRRIKNQRRDFHHKLSRQLINNYDLVVFEDLSIDNMIKNPYLAKSISDAGWSQLIRFTSYKAEDAGSWSISINPNGTTQECCICGEKNLEQLSLAQRTFKCSNPNCGNVMDRDENASINIRNRGLEKLGFTAGTAGRACMSSPIGDAMIQEATQLVGW